MNRLDVKIPKGEEDELISEVNNRVPEGTLSMMKDALFENLLMHKYMKWAKVTDQLNEENGTLMLMLSNGSLVHVNYRFLERELTYALVRQ